MRGPDECWPFTGHLHDDGYGRFFVRGKPIRAHRAAYISSSGSDPGDLVVRHTCDNRPCCNPAHLLTGTVLDNNRDMKERGRYRHHRGGKAPGAKLSDEQALAIRVSDEIGRVLGLKYGVSKTTIENVKSGKSFGHLPSRSDLLARGCAGVDPCGLTLGPCCDEDGLAR